MKKRIALLILAWVPILLWAQRGALSGIVTDAQTGETLVGASVVLDGSRNRGTSTDVNGFFSLSGIETSTGVLKVSFVGYTSVFHSFKFEGNTKPFVEIKLQPSKSELSEILVVEKGANRTGDREVEISQHQLTARAIRVIPTARNDVFKAVRYLPGVEGTEPLSPLVSVRGSDPGENLIQLDGVTIYNPYHFMSSAGVFNMQTVKNVDVLAGGFGAEYGGRNASVITIWTKDGDMSGLHGEVKATTAETRTFFEFPLGEKTTAMVAGRINYDLAGNFMMYSNNYFYDANVSLTHRFNSRNRVTLKYFSSKDRTNLDFNSIYKYMGASMGDEMGEALETMSLKWVNQWNNRVGAVTWKSMLGPRLFLQVQTSASMHRADNFSEMNMLVEDVAFDTSTKFGGKVNDFGAKLSLDYDPFYWSSLKVGAEYNSYSFFNGSELNHVELQSAERAPQLLALFVEDKLKLGSLILRPGVRAVNYDNAGFRYEPRVNAVLNVGDTWSAQAAWGLYNQYIVSMNTQEFEFNQFLDYYYPLQGVEPSQSVHYMAGVEKRLNASNTLSVDLYYKDIRRTYMFDLLQSQYEVFALSDKVVAGKGATLGMELMWKGQVGKVSGWASYTLSKSTRSFPHIMNGDWYDYDYDRRHSFKAVLNYQVTQRISYSASFRSLSGVPRSVENTMQMYYMYDPLTGTMIYSPQYTVDRKNATRMPWLFYLDLGLEKEVVSGFGKDISRFFGADRSYFTLDVYNVLFFRRNILYYIPTGGADLFIPMGDNYLPGVSAGYTIKF